MVSSSEVYVGQNYNNYICSGLAVALTVTMAVAKSETPISQLKKDLENQKSKKLKCTKPSNKKQS